MDKYQLRQYIWIMKEIDSLEEEKKIILDKYLAPPIISDMPHGTGVTDRIGNIVSKRCYIQDKIDQKLDELICLKEQIENAISGLDPNERLLIRLKYCEGLTWEEVAVRLNYTWRHVHRIHKNILQKLENMS